MFYRIASSKHCPRGMADVMKLKYELPFVEFFKLHEYVEMMNAVDIANNKDQEAEAKRAQQK